MLALDDRMHGEYIANDIMHVECGGVPLKGVGNVGNGRCTRGGCQVQCRQDDDIS
jgi:hypothetical protein